MRKSAVRLKLVASRKWSKIHINISTRHSPLVASTSSRGFTLLFAALISSIVLALGISIVSIAIKQVQLSSATRESQYAFYAADSGAECALYWDIRYGYFGQATPVLPSPPLPPKCDGQLLNASPLNPSAYPYTMTFQYSPSALYCVKVSVKKTQVATPNGTTIQTVIHADGYNTRCTSINNTATLQRSVELNY